MERTVFRTLGFTTARRSLIMEEGSKFRSINVNHNNPGFSSNAVHNTKYKWWSFVFVNVMEQLIQPLNTYFVLEACLELFPIISAYNPLTTWIPIIWIFTLTAIREAFEDIRRYRHDKVANNRIVRVLRGDLLVEVKSQDLQVGDIVYLEEHEEVPCDLVVLASSEEYGCCYIQTMNIDGETNLKLRKIPPGLDKVINGTTTESIQHQLNSSTMTIKCELPNAHIYKFNGTLRLNDSTDISLSPSNLLLQVTRLENTKYIYGVVVYTGHETKFGQNKSKPILKLAVSDRMTSVFTVVVLCLQILLVICLSPIGISLNKGNEQWYLEKTTAALNAIIPLRFLLLNVAMVPSTLKVTLELIKILYTTFIHYDEHFYDKQAKKSRVSCNSTVLCETLGNIRYLFTDKTGTLTKNELILREVIVGGEDVGIPDMSSSEYGTCQPTTSFKSENSVSHDFLTCILLCNSCVRVENGLKSDNPDELALLYGIQSMGAVIETKVDKTVTLRFGENVEHWTILRVIAFSSDRKRMSVIAQNDDTKEIRVFTKGADEMIVPRFLQGVIKRGESSFNCDELKKQVLEGTHQTSQKGYRSLVFGCRDLTETQWKELEQNLHDAEIRLENREEAVETSVGEIEKEFIPLGVSGIEDALQDEVKETISHFIACGIQVWLVTGDQVNTAVNICCNCGITQKDAEHIIMNSHDSAVIQKQMNQVMSLENPNHASVIITGSVLSAVLADKQCKAFFEALLKVQSVICCRVTPKQKSDLVLEVKKITREMTMAVGDGGNDVSMILNSNCGVGIRGKEGEQAARAGDFVITEFKDLKRLLCVHGVNNYSRSWSITSYSLYKSIVLCSCQTLYCFYSLFSGSSLFNSFHLTYYSIAIFIPIAGLVLKRVFPDEQLLNDPSIYAYYNKSSNYHSSAYSIKQFVFWVLLGLLQGFILVLVGIYGICETDRDFLSEFVFFSIYSLQDIMLLITVPNATGLQVGMILFMHLLLWSLTLLQSFVNTTGGMVPFMALNYAIGKPTYWLGRLAVLFIAVLPFACVRIFQNKN